MDESREAFWPTKLEELKNDKGLGTYQDLAALLSMSKSGLAHVLSGRQELSMNAKLLVLKELGGEVNEYDFENLLTRKARRAVGSKVDQIFDPENGHALEGGFWVDRIDELKYRFKVKNDYELARSLSISPSVISDLRMGRDALSTVAKIKVLDKLAYTAARSLLLDLFPPRVKKRLEDFDNLRFKKRD